CLRICSEENRWAKKQGSKQANEKSLTTFNAAAICFASLPMARYALARRRIAARFTANGAVRLNLFLIAIAAPRAVRAPNRDVAGLVPGAPLFASGNQRHWRH